MFKTIAIALLLTPLFVGQSTAATNVGLGCTTAIWCCIPGKGCFSPNTPTGYTCNDGHAQTVTICKHHVIKPIGH
jgi:hypothetical protein